MRGAIERLWYDSSWPARIGRAALAPVSWLYGIAVACRNALYDRGLLATERAALPAVSIGNLAVGGTGKTPVAAWVAGELARRGARPAIVMRGYGGDEPLVHRALNPGIPVLTGADRARSLAAARDGGCDVAVMDDAFQHRRVTRTVDVVLVSADRWQERMRLLPAGPGREPMAALRRASLVVVTRKAADRTTASSIARRLGSVVGGVVPVVSLALESLVDFHSGERRPISGVNGVKIVLVAGIGDPAALGNQLRAAGAIVRVQAFPDHHVYEPSDIAALVSGDDQGSLLVCTLKDAVKLGSLWPRGAGPLWYVSQRCECEEGGAAMEALLDRVLAARASPNNPRPASPGASPTLS